MPSDAFHELSEFYLTSISMLLRGAGVRPASVNEVCSSIANGRADLVSAWFGDHMIGTLRVRNDSPQLAELLTHLTTLAPQLYAERIALEVLKEFAKIASGLGELCEHIHADATAYNFHEVAYHFYDVAGLPSLETAEKLRILSNPENIDQFHGAIWRLAIEQVRYACTEMSDWLEAIAAFELALSCPVESPEFQRRLCDGLELQLKRARETPISDLIAIYFIQAPAAVIPAEQREMTIRLLCEAENYDGALHSGMEILAMAKAQAMVDDMRQALQPVDSSHPYIEWSNVRIRHDRLSGAVPLGQSLIADIERTKWLLPDLIHEIGHAVALLGPIGIYQSAFRASVHHLEAHLLDLAKINPEAGKIRAAKSLPTHEAAQLLAVTQLRAAANASIAQSIWTPWLEGLSMYYELVCDPKDDETEISAIHECVRLLIDFDVPPLPTETPEEYGPRMMNEVSRRFENFISEVLRDTSRINNLRYFDAPERGESDIYILGYLVVRSIVSSWEATLGRRLVPMRAAVLLLNATQAATADAFPPLTLAPGDFLAASQSHLTTWLASLAGLPKEAIESFLEPVAREDTTPPVLWDGMIPRKVTQDEFVAAHEAWGSNTLEPQVQKLAGIDPDSSDESATRRGEGVLALFRAYVVFNKLLPIGEDNARMIFMQSSDYVGVCPRTYVGKRGAKESGDPADGPRYSPRFWRNESPEERQRVQRLFGREGTPRVAVARVIDLVGFPDAPVPTKMSYICFFLGSEYSRVSSWLNQAADESKDHLQFTRMLHRRVVDAGLFHEEQSTLGSLTFLAERLERAGNLPDALKVVHSIDRKQIAIDAAMNSAAAAFSGGDREAFASHYYDGVLRSRRRHAIATIVHSTGFGRLAEAEPALEDSVLASLVFSASSFSGVRPFGS